MQVQPPSNNLGTFKILFLVKGILSLVVSLVPLVYAFLGLFLQDLIEENNPSDAFVVNPGTIFYIFGLVGFFLLILWGVMALIASRYLGEMRNYNFIFVVAIMHALTGILGLLLCIFTLIELTKPDVKALFTDRR